MQSFDTAAQPYAATNKHKPPVPEASAYGFILVLLCLVALAMRRRK